jgi:hypothetical protein
LSAQVRRSHFYSRFKTPLVVSPCTHSDI